MGVVSNKIEREELNAGDHIYSWRLAYTYAHHGIFVGEGKVIHFTQEASQETGTGKVSDRTVFSSASFYPLGIPCPNCGYMSKLHGVISSCIDCFLSGGNLYRFEYGVSLPWFLVQARGGTCTLAPSDPPEEVLHRASYILQNSFGKYNISRNNCEDFAIYCKTGLRVIPSIGKGCSGQVASFDAAGSVALKFFTGGFSTLKFLSPSFSAACAVVLAVDSYCASRLASDIGVRRDVVKVPVEGLVAKFGLGNSDSKGGSEIDKKDSLLAEKSVVESRLSNSDSEGVSENGKKASLSVERLVAESGLGNSDSEGGSKIGKKDSLPMKKLVKSGFGNSGSDGESEIGKKDYLSGAKIVTKSGLGNSDFGGESKTAIGSSEDVEFRCFVSGLAWATTDKALKEAFSQFGKILESKVINHRETGRSRGFGFVTFSDEKSMRDAIKDMNGQNIDGRKIMVNEAQSRRSRGSNVYSRRGGRGAYRRGGGGRGEGGYYRGGGHNGYNESSRGGYGGGRDRGYGDGGPRYSKGGGASGGDQSEGGYNRDGGGGGSYGGGGNYERSSRDGGYRGNYGRGRDHAYGDGSRYSRWGGGGASEGNWRK